MKKGQCDLFSTTQFLLLFFVLSIPWASIFGFGKNKVQYKDLTWSYHKIPHFYSYFHQDQGDLPKITAQWIENAYTELAKDFGFKHKKRIPLIIYGSPTLFEQTNVTPGIIPEGVGGFTESLKNRIVMPFNGSYEEFRHVLHHELVHAFQFGILFDQFGGSILRVNAAQMPLWFAEGSAEYLSSDWDSDADMFLMDRTIYGNVPLPGFSMGGYMVYKGGQSFLYFLAKTHGDSTFHRFLQEFRTTKRVNESLEKVYKKKLEDLGKEWHRELKRIYWPEIGIREDLQRKAEQITSREKSRSSFNLRPRISPNGAMIAYYSDAKDYTKIFITDRKKKIRLKISQQGFGDQFESFQPFRSGMCWGPESDQLAFVAKNDGKNELRVVNIKTKKHAATYKPKLASITSPDWSPDGNSFVFVGLKNHQTDVYQYTLNDNKLIQLTNDIQSESNPRFSPDGSLVIFAKKDTCGIAQRKNFSQHPKSNLFLIDLNDNSVKQITNTQWNEKQPTFSPNGKDIAFVCDKNGINNIYIAPLHAPDSAKPLTNIIGGCSNPDWSSKDYSIVFTLFQKQGWEVWLIEEPRKKIIEEELAPTLWVKSNSDTTISYFLPPLPPKDTIDTALLNEAISAKSERQQRKKRKKSGKANETLQPIQDSSKTTPELDSTTQERTKTDTTADQSNDLSKNEAIVLSDSLTDSTSIDLLDQTEQSSDSSTSSLSDSKKTQKQKVIKDTTVVIPKDIKEHPYKPKFSVDMVSVGMGYSTIYGAAGQGFVVFSDLLGNHQIALAGNIQSSWEENNIFGSYFNSQYRIDFGLAAFYDKHYVYATLDYYDLYHDTNIGGEILFRYPFSLFSRIDFDLFYQHLKREPYRIERRGLVPNDSLDKVSVNITKPSLSYTFDNILWGITGPINGLRASASLVVAPPLQADDPSFVSLDVDVRKYFHLNRRFVWANKFSAGFSEPMGDNDSPRIYFLGGNENWLIWRINPDNFADNLNKTIYSQFIVPFRGWNYFDLIGTRYAVLNTEFRFPFIRAIDIVWPLPMRISYINGAIFADMGNAWFPEDQYDVIPLPKKIYGGIGFGLRANLGMFILRYDLAWKTDWHRYIKDPINYFSLGAEF